MIHSFQTELADKYGLHESIFISHFGFWIEKNIANNKNIHDGKVWTYNSLQAFQEIFYYMPPRRIRTTIERLVEQGVIEKGNFNKVKYDRTAWYSFTDSFIKSGLCPLSHLSISSNRNDAIPANRSDKIDTPIPDIKPVLKPDNTRNQRFLPLSNLLIQKITENEPRYFGKKDTESIAKKWADDFRLLIEKDGREYDEVREIIIWCQENDFWKKNILSASKLRIQYGKLLIQMSADKPKKKKYKERVYDETDPLFSEDDIVSEVLL